MFGVYRPRTVTKTGPLQAEYKYWFKIKDQMIREHPHMQIGIVGHRVVAIKPTREEVLRKVLAKYGDVLMLIIRADDEDYDGDWWI